MEKHKFNLQKPNFNLRNIEHGFKIQFSLAIVKQILESSEQANLDSTPDFSYFFTGKKIQK